MEQLKTTTSATSGAAIPLSAGAPRGNVILLACLHGVEAMSVLLPDLRQGVVGRTGRHNFVAGRLQVLLEKRLGRIKQFFGASGEALFSSPAGLTKTARSRELRNKPDAGAADRVATVECQKAPLERIDLLERELADAEIPIPREADWFPLVKVSAAPAAVSIAESTCGCDTFDAQQASPGADSGLSGRCVLCVGGRAALYPEYRRLVETSGGTLLIYRGGLPNGGEHLPALLSRADIVVCPVDCVNHHTFFTVKRYCKHSGKPCVLLDRSGLPTFRKGVATLVALVAQTA